MAGVEAAAASYARPTLRAAAVLVVLPGIGASYDIVSYAKG